MYRLKMPPAVPYLHAMNVLTTFSYAALYSSLSLYLTHTMKISHAESNRSVSLFIAMNFVLHLLSGYLGGRLLSNRALFITSLFFQMMGVFILSLSTLDLIFWGLSFFLMGCGINSTSLKCILTQQFTQNDERRETAFYINYCAMNIGFFLGFIASGYFDLHDSYASLFYLCNIFNIMTLCLTLFSWKYLCDKDTPLIKMEKKASNFFPGISSILLLMLVPIVFMAFKQSNLANNMVLVIGVAALLVILFSTVKNTNKIEKNKIYAYLILSVASIVFWMIFFVGPMGVTHFLKYNVEATLFSYPIAPQWIMNLNSIFIILGSPLFAFLFTQLRRRGFNFSISKQFSCSLIAIGLSFFFLSLGILDSNQLGLTGVLWIVLHFLIQAVGELLIAPVGLAMIGKLAPTNLQGVMMGIWMMVPGVSATLSQYFSNGMTKSETIEPMISNLNYFDTFNQLGIYAFIAAMLLILIAKQLDRYINEITEPNINREMSNVA